MGAIECKYIVKRLEAIVLIYTIAASQDVKLFDFIFTYAITV